MTRFETPKIPDDLGLEPRHPLARRQFLHAVAGGIAGWAAWRLARPRAAADAAPWPDPVRLCASDEPGEPMLITGCIFARDGVTPAPGVVLYVYHTDASGVYADAGQPPRLRGWMRSDARGRYAYRTIRPAPYPESTQAAHVHTQLWSEAIPPHWGTTLVFVGDEFVTDRDRKRSRALGRFGFVRRLRRGRDGVWRGRHHLRVRGEGDAFETSTRHGLDGAPPRFRPPRSGRRDPG